MNMKKLVLVALAALGVVCLPLLLHAQPTPEVGDQIGTLVDASRTHDWQIALAAGLGLLAWAIRRFVQPSAFVHTAAGGFVIAGASAAIGAIVPVLQVHAFTIAALVGAVASGITAAVALANPSTASATAGAAKSGVSTPPASLLLLFVGGGLGLAATLAGCACLKAENAQRAECVVEHQVIDCAKQAGQSLLPVIGSIISGFINSGSATIDWSWIEQRLEAAGVVSGSCIFANLANDLVTKAAASPAHATRAREAEDRFTAWKARHGLSGVKFKIRTPDGRVVLR